MCLLCLSSSPSRSVQVFGSGVDCRETWIWDVAFRLLQLHTRRGQQTQIFFLNVDGEKDTLTNYVSIDGPYGELRMLQNWTRIRSRCHMQAGFSAATTGTITKALKQ